MGIIAIVALFAIHIIAGKSDDSGRKCKKNGGTCLLRCKEKGRAVTPSDCPKEQRCCMKPSGRNIAKPRDKKENVKIARIGKKVKEDKKGKQAKKTGRKENVKRRRKGKKVKEPKGKQPKSMHRKGKGKQGSKGKTVKGKPKVNKGKNEKIGKKNGKKYIPRNNRKKVNGNRQG